MCKGEKSSELPELRRPSRLWGRDTRGDSGAGPRYGSLGTLSESGTGNALRFNQMCSPPSTLRLKWERDLCVSLL